MSKRESVSLGSDRRRRRRRRRRCRSQRCRRRTRTLSTHTITLGRQGGREGSGGAASHGRQRRSTCSSAVSLSLSLSLSSSLNAVKPPPFFGPARSLTHPLLFPASPLSSFTAAGVAVSPSAPSRLSMPRRTGPSVCLLTVIVKRAQRKKNTRTLSRSLARTHATHAGGGNNAIPSAALLPPPIWRGGTDSGGGGVSCCEADYALSLRLPSFRLTPSLPSSLPHTTGAAATVSSSFLCLQNFHQSRCRNARRTSGSLLGRGTARQAITVQALHFFAGWLKLPIDCVLRRGRAVSFIMYLSRVEALR